MVSSQETAVPPAAGWRAISLSLTRPTWWFERGGALSRRVSNRSLRSRRSRAFRPVLHRRDVPRLPGGFGTKSSVASGTAGVRVRRRGGHGDASGDPRAWPAHRESVALPHSGVRPRCPAAGGTGCALPERRHLVVAVPAGITRHLSHRLGGGLHAGGGLGGRPRPLRPRPGRRG